MQTYIGTGTINAIAAGLTGQDVRGLAYGPLHNLCGKNPDAATGEPFYWDVARELIAQAVESTVEAEDGTIV